ncbi:MAG: hypothetical protein ACJ71N_05940 [Terriglobales bacterium]
MQIVRIISAGVFASVMLFLAALHVYWARGGKWATDAVVPTIDGRGTLDAGPLPT